MDEEEPHQLLALPAEIILNILQHALICPTPLRFAIPARDVLHENHDVMHQILRCLLFCRDALSLLSTCRKVREEGLSIFWEENVFQLDVFPNKSLLDLTFHYKQERSLERAIPWVSITDRTSRYNGSPFDSVSPLPITKSIRRLYVSIHDTGKFIDRFDYYTYAKLAVHDACAAVSTCFNLSQIDLQVELVKYEHDPDHFVHQGEFIPDESILAPLEYLRGTQKLSVHGVSENYTVRLKSQIMRPAATEDVWRMRRDYIDWLSHIDNDTWIPELAVEFVEDAWLDCDMAEFRRLRDILLRSYEDYQAEPEVD